MRRPGQLHGVLAAVLALFGACANTAPDPIQPLDSAFEVPVGRTVRIVGTTLEVHFVGVSNDSRCPTDVQCVTAGDATIELQVAADGAAGVRYELHSNDGAREVVHAGYRLTFVDLKPLPVSTRPIRAGDYVVTLRVSRL